MILSPLNQVIMVNKAVAAKGVADIFLVSLTRPLDQFSSLAKLPTLALKMDIKDPRPALKVDIKIETVDTTQLTDPQGRLLPDGWVLTKDDKGRVTYKNLDSGQIIWYNPNDIVKDVDVDKRSQKSECVMQ
jgi:hypothetical protein